jgi:hypothetical protein
MQTAQSMHSSGSITSMFGPSWKQSTGQTSTQSVYLHLMQLSVTTWVIDDPRVPGGPDRPAPSTGRNYTVFTRPDVAARQHLWQFAYARPAGALESGSAGLEWADSRTKRCFGEAP